MDKSILDKFSKGQNNVFIQKPSQNQNDKQILTFVMNNGSSFPDALNFDVNTLGRSGSHDAPIVTDENSKEFNAPYVCNKLINTAIEFSNQQKYNDIMIPMGEEFAYENAYVTFLSMERVLDYIKKNYKNLNMEFKFSTPSEYIKAVKNDIDVSKLALYQGDFLPFQDKQGNVMSGYFTSKPDFKKEIKMTSSINHI